VIRRGETLSDIAHAYGLSVEALRRANQLRTSNHLIVGEALRIPTQEGRQDVVDARQLFPSRERAPSLAIPPHGEPRGPTPATTSSGFQWPVQGPLTSPFGERDHVMGGGGTQFHAGIDISVPAGTPVQAAQEGIVVFAGYNGAYGKAIKLDHPNGLSTLYAHNSRLLVYVGQTVKAGEVICLSGSTGRSTGPHLHFEVHKDGTPVDPLLYLE
jgi:murein DD-endopeptidase MepM/ murein hydrolase activator NlpD